MKHADSGDRGGKNSCKGKDDRKTKVRKKFCDQMNAMKKKGGMKAPIKDTAPEGDHSEDM